MTETLGFYNFSYDAGNRITQISDIDGITNYSYDQRNQLVEADRDNPNNPDEFYSYDENGNRTSSSLHGDGYVTSANNRLQSDGVYNYEYDPQGNLIRQTEIATGNVREYQWDYWNRLVAIVDQQSDIPTLKVEFTYDVFNRRISKSVDEIG